MPDLRRAGASLHYELEGTGPLLILLHGFTGSVESFADLSRRLQRRCRVARLELLGHGLSDAPQEYARYGMWEAAQDVLALMKELGEAKAHLLGYSLGGRVALRAALLAPERLHSLILESASPGIPSDAERADRRASDEALCRLLDEQGIEAFTNRWEAAPLFATQARCPPERRAQQRAVRLGQRPHGLIGSLRGAGAGATDDVSGRLQEIRVPTLLIAGARDPKYRGTLRQMARAMSTADYRVVTGAGHNVHFEKPRVYARMVEEFLVRTAR
ncbi:MAG: 2-succinyl-6-hydroxy-2,4-cyclohexadiene-1-carboxylate synthase [Thermaerobacter sp.]|nr:2-succinyl-6-hydroxy-2,4-cyclohexadiene-1-carboxylate synthase [Thermaerobacter sp.]